MKKSYTHSMLIDCHCPMNQREPRIVHNLSKADLNVLLFNDRIIEFSYYRDCFGRLTVIKYIHCKTCRKKEKTKPKDGCRIS